MAAYRGVHDSRHRTCRLTAKDWDQPRNPTLGNRVWVTFTFFISISIQDTENHIILRPLKYVYFRLRKGYGVYKYGEK